MPTVTWKILPAEGDVVTVRTEARTLFDKMTSDATTYRVFFPLKSVDAFGNVHEFEFDRAKVDEFGRLDIGKSIRVPVKSIMTFVHPQTKATTRQEATAVSVLTVERQETIEVPAGKFDTIVIRIDAEGAQATPAVSGVVRRYWFAPALGWYVRHELLATGPQLRQHNEYVAVKITRTEERSQAR